jgi:hypothetical protein
VAPSLHITPHRERIVGISRSDVERWFTYQAPEPEDIEKLRAIRAGAKALAHVILANTPSGAEQSAAVRKLREVVTTANSAIVCRERAPAQLDALQRRARADLERVARQSEAMRGQLQESKRLVDVMGLKLLGLGHPPGAVKGVRGERKGALDGADLACWECGNETFVDREKVCDPVYCAGCTPEAAARAEAAARVLLTHPTVQPASPSTE